MVVKIIWKVVEVLVLSNCVKSWWVWEEFTLSDCWVADVGGINISECERKECQTW